ncbi:MAG: hypothetical protein HY331_06585 [Chloroflexi bacterium]|nr:hypothetical protein [Chloroflexota bacterium]
MHEVSWRSMIPHPIEGPDDAAAFVAALGFCTWGPVPGLDFPNLAEAMGETAWSVLERTWYWKDDLHLERRLYYARVIRGQPSFIAPEYLPDFVAALGGRGLETERDPARLYLAGRLSHEARLIYEHLADHPALPTRDLRRGTGLRSKDRATATERGLIELQRRFLICKVDLTGRTRGTYSYVWDLAERFWPEAFEEARSVTPAAARARLRSRLAAFGLAPNPELETRLFVWKPL